MEFPFHLIPRLGDFDVWRCMLLLNSLQKIRIHEDGNYCYADMFKITYEYNNMYIYKKNKI